MNKNKVRERCKKESVAKFYYSADSMFRALKVSRGILYVIAIIPVIMTFIPAISAVYVFVCSVISFGISLLNEALTSFLNEYKKKAIMEYQLYETGATGSEFSKIEYDRETTNELNELAIRKGLPRMREKETLNELSVPDDMSDDYSYIYLCRKEAATTKYMLSRIFYIYFVFLILIAVCFVFAIFFKSNTMEYLSLLITFYPIVSPIIKACGKCKECMKDCTKMCADIDNFFADGDTSVERLARMHYYVQNLEFEMLTNRPAIYSLFSRIFRHGIEDLEEGVTTRFQLAIVELKGKAMMQKGMIAPPKGKALITKVDYDLDKLNKIEQGKKKGKPAARPTKSAEAEEVAASSALPEKTQKPANKVENKPAAKTENKSAAKTAEAAKPVTKTETAKPAVKTENKSAAKAETKTAAKKPAANAKPTNEKPATAKPVNEKPAKSAAGAKSGAKKTTNNKQ